MRKTGTASAPNDLNVWQERSVGFYGADGGGLSSIVKYDIGALADLAYGGVFVLALIPESVGVFGGLVGLRDGLNTKFGFSLTLGNTENLLFTVGSNSFNCPLRVPLNRWVSLYAQKASGASIARTAMSDGAAWQLANTISLLNNNAVALTEITIGSAVLSQIASFSFVGNIAAVAIFKNRVLSDATIQTLHTKAGLVASAPDAYWLLNNISPEAPIPELVAGIVQTARQVTGIGAPVPKSWVA